MKGLIPESLDLDSHLKKFPPTKYRFNELTKDNLIYLLSQITLVPAKNRKVLDSIEENYVPLSSKRLQSYVHDYTKYWKYLELTKVIEIRKNYRPEIFFEKGRCKGYRFAEAYSNVGFKVVSYSPKFYAKLKLRKKIKLGKKFNELKGEYSHLLKWLYPKCNLQIDAKAAGEFLQLERDALIKAPELREKRNRGKDKIFKTGKTKNPYFQYELAKVNIESISSGDVYFTVDETVNRLHSILTNMKSTVRNFITYEGKQLISIDLVNSQPYLSTQIFQRKFWATTLSMLNNNNKSTNKQTNTPTKPPTTQTNKQTNNKTTPTTNIPPYMLELITKCVDNQDIKIFSGLVSDSKTNEEDIYKFMEKEFDKRGIKHDGRKDIKNGMFEVLFTSNKHHTEAKNIFKELFPTVNEFFEQVKSNNKADLPILLQRLESHIMLKIITRKIAVKYHNKIPLFTVHDSIVTTVDYADIVQKMMHKELESLMGIPPMLKVEPWNQNDKKLNKLRKKYEDILNGTYPVVT